MPYMHISTSARLSDAQIRELHESVARLIPLIPGKTYDVTMIHIDGGQSIHLRGLDAPGAFVDLRLMGPAPLADKQRFTEAFTAELERIAGVDAAHVYLNILEMREWGSGGTYRRLPD